MKRFVIQKSFLLLLCVVIQACEGQEFEKINGVSFVASAEKVTEKNIKPLENLGANYAAIMPFAFVRSLEYPEVIYDGEHQWFGETEAGVKQYISELRKANIKIMIKPQLWVSKGAFTGEIKMKSQEDWEKFEKTYANFILKFAQLAAELNVKLFCIGTELERFVESRPQFWKELIVAVRKVYKGKITYAANWNEFEKTPFWSELDYIGVDAYFPLGSQKTPDLETLEQNWSQWNTILSTTATLYKKPILFTEFGYRSVDYNTKMPWDSKNIKGKVNHEAQSNALEATFLNCWDKDWFAGGFVWKWFIDYEKVGGLQNNRFTPQNKPAEKVIKKYFKKYDDG